jgi:prepilin peptidase CpaA
MTPLPAGVQAVLSMVVLVAAAGDLKSRRIPNWLTASALCAGVVLHIVLSGASGAWFALKGAGLALLIYLPLFVLRAVGAGDAKLMAGVGALAGPGNWLVIFVLTAMTGGVLALIVTLWRGELGRTLGNIVFILKRLLTLKAPYRERPELDAAHERAATLPHALAIAIGTICFLLGASGAS